MHELPNREEVDGRIYEDLDPILGAYVDGTLLTRAEAASDAEVIEKVLQAARLARHFELTQPVADDPIVQAQVQTRLSRLGYRIYPGIEEVVADVEVRLRVFADLITEAPIRQSCATHGHLFSVQWPNACDGVALLARGVDVTLLCVVGPNVALIPVEATNNE